MREVQQGDAHFPLAVYDARYSFSLLRKDSSSFLLQVQINDLSDSQWLTLFDESAQMVMERAGGGTREFETGFSFLRNIFY